MADDILLNSGTGGDTIAADDIGPGVKYPRTKITLGADGVNSGDVAAANPMPVQISDGTDTVAVSAAGAASVDVASALPTGANTIGDVTVSGAALTALQKTDNIAHAGSDVALVEHVPISGQLDDVATTTVTENQIAPVRINASRALHVDGSGVTQPVSGTVTATPSGTQNVDVTANTIGLATSANQLPDGHNVTVDNAAGAAAVNIQDGGNKITVDWNGTDPPIGGGTEAAALRVTMATDAPSQTVDNGGTFAVQSTLQAGTALAGDVGISGARTSGGTTPYYNDGVATETQIKGTGGQLYWISAINVSASVRYLQLFNNTAAAVIPGTTTPTNEWPVPTQGDTNGAGFMISIPNGIAYGTAITFFISTAKGGGVAATADDVLLNIGYA